MIKVVSIVALIIITLTAQSQNLILNGDLNSYIECPSRLSMFNKVSEWYNPNFSLPPDYFNVCSLARPSGSYDALLKESGLSEGGCAGIVLVANHNRFYHTSIAIPLINELEKDSFYEICLDVKFSSINKYNSSFVSFFFSDERIPKLKRRKGYDTIVADRQRMRQISTSSCDDKGWTELKVPYQAIGGENYLIIGRFHNDMTRKEYNSYMKIIESYKLSGHELYLSYLFIDNVSILPIK